MLRVDKAVLAAPELRKASSSLRGDPSAALLNYQTNPRNSNQAFFVALLQQQQLHVCVPGVPLWWVNHS
jgi:hypothetical protein